MSLDELKQAVIDGDGETAVSLTTKAISDDVDPHTIINEALTAGMKVVGELYEEGEFFLPEMLVAAEAMKGAMEVLRPVLTAGEHKSKGKVVLGTVEGDLHDIGKRLVGIMLEGRGFEVIDLGTGVPADEFARAAKESGADLVGLSALLTSTLPTMAKTIELLRELESPTSVRTMVGGAAVTADYADRIGAHGYAPDASRAAALALELVGLE